MLDRIRSRVLQAVLLGFNALALETALRPVAMAVTTAVPSPSVPAAAQYVGALACVSCHEQQHQAWRGSNHQRAMEPATAETVRGDFGGQRFSDGRIRARFFRKGHEFLVRTDGPDGTPADFPVTYTFGVEPMQQYLIPLPGGRLQSLTVAWDTRPKDAGGQRWFNLYPHETIVAGDPLHWTGTDQNWNYMCASCHSTNLRRGYDTSTGTYATTWTDINVACEACHGPGSRHVDWARARTPVTEAPPAQGNGLLVHFPEEQLARWTIDPATGNARPGARPAPDTELDTCAPCHTRRSTIAAEYVPGEPLLDAYVPMLLTEGLYFPDGQVQGEVYEYGSFVQSRMYHAGVTCRNCHEPHSLALRAPGNGVCAQCHSPAKYDSPKHHFHGAGSKGASCIGCHMPARMFMIVDARHDHSLRVPRPDLSVSLGTPNACNMCHTDRDAVWARDHLRTWYGRDAAGYQRYAAALQAGRTGAPGASAATAALVLDESQPAIARATALAQLPRFFDAQSIDTLQRGLRDSHALVRRAAAGALYVLPPAQRLRLAQSLLADPILAVRIEAARQLAGVSPEVAGPEAYAQIQLGLAEFTRAQQVDADRPEARVNLCTLFGEQRNWRAAEAECRAAMRLQPTYGPAYVNLADIYRVAGRDGDGEQVLREGLAVAADAAIHHALGLLLVRKQRHNEALRELQRAVELQPDEPRYSYVLGVALHSAGKSDQALATLKAANKRHPWDRDVLFALATMSRDSNRGEDARAYARELIALTPDDPAARQLLQQLGGAP
jgi:tetratricopeptide (TPR) repeat protein